MAGSVLILGCMMQEYAAGSFPLVSQFDERWGINNCYIDFHKQATEEEKLTRIIAMDDLKRDLAEYPNYVTAITKAGVPVVTSTAYREWPCTQDYPLGAVLPHIGKCRLDNSINYAVALAMYEGAKRIGLWSCEFTRPDPKWITRRDMGDKPDWFTYYQEDAVFNRRGREPGVETLMYLLGLCYGRGIEVITPSGSTLFDDDRPPFYYGYQEQPNLD